MGDGCDVVGIGICAFDVLVEVDQFPELDRKAVASAIEGQGGGLIGTALVTVARLGGRAAYMGPLGDDMFADLCFRDFRKEGVETRLIRRVEGASVVTAVVLVDRRADTRTILWKPDESLTLSPGEISEDAVRGAAALLVDWLYPDAAVRAAEVARAAGVPVVVDLESNDELTDRLLPVADYPVLPLAVTRNRYGRDSMEDCARALFDEVSARGGRAGVVTAGARGSVAVTADRVHRQPAYRSEVVDTTGCGDVYHGAFALGLARGWDLERTMRVASATAALKCRKSGGRAGIPGMAEVEAFLRTAEPVD